MPDTVNYFEIGTPDPAAARTFYGSLFGWQLDDDVEPGGYGFVDGGKGGLWDTSEMGGGTWAVFYVHVDDVAATIAAAVAAGASVVLPLVDNGAIEFAHLTDPAGSRFGVWHRKAVG